MRYLKMLGLAMISAFALMAIGAGSASAVTLCKEAKTPCPEAQRYPSSTTWHLTIKVTIHTQLTTSIGTVTCKKTTIHGGTTSTGTNPLLGSITSVSDSECTLGSTPCTVTHQNLPYKGTVTAGATVGNGTVKAESGGVGKPQAKVECGSFINCTFGAPEVSFSVVGGNPAIATFSQSLEREGGLCPSTSTAETEYEVVEPKPLFIVA
jgi:hypothetical protein